MLNFIPFFSTWVRLLGIRHQNYLLIYLNNFPQHVSIRWALSEPKLQRHSRIIFQPLQEGFLQVSLCFVTIAPVLKLTNRYRLRVFRYAGAEPQKNFIWKYSTLAAKAESRGFHIWDNRVVFVVDIPNRLKKHSIDIGNWYVLCESTLHSPYSKNNFDFWVEIVIEEED